MDLYTPSPQNLVEEYIHNTFEGLNQQLALPASQAQPSVTLRSRVCPGTYIVNHQNGSLEASRSTELTRTYSWPGKTAFEAWRFTVIIRVLAIIEQAIKDRKTVTKRSVILYLGSEEWADEREPGRDIYYIDPAYFKSQVIINNIIEDLAYTIGVNRAALNVEAAGKGLVAGPVVLKREGQVILDARSSQDSLIPRIYEEDEIDIFVARWVLIVEKEAVFHRLVRNNYHTTALAGEGIIVTGKGYPDIFTRAFLRRLLEHAARVRGRTPPFYALVDGDPDGLAIMSIFKYGSAAHAHDNYMYTIPTLQCLGLRVSETVPRVMNYANKASSPLSMRDRQKVISMLRNNPAWASNGPETESRVELQRMLMLNIKAEIEMLYDQNGGLEGWIDRKMFRQE
ncbi:Winged helix-turn-helix transcription repressor DNA-binding [Penicillium chermesinum]|uniref:DNA topoisomerase (ATP-hydrolyzing) n=1 Tax=Penicillium chermesinum TaxID=63820 RepID=A0A9W9TRR3_9EURO|nr:Winged helix-turn-helix transcription repressor DNA-binding [Penicillium chermesinum]KAJ5238971.1 Winged helix-turn-helix transcription repressor DNA-binding [Penicillium chermesinum]KAJ6164614.1 Winged helix-turn-helix transcription repressor DNA-binding [Penicillium chermesinum]